MSGVGKGTSISSIGKLLRAQNYVITAIKIDPYLNIDAGTMAPAEHGEVYVLNDGGEVDLDLGNYERSLEISLNKNHNITSGKVYFSILRDERQGKYLGKTIQMVPHVTERIMDMIEKTAENFRDNKNRKADICLVEVGGTVGDLESGIFFEAIRQFINKKGNKNCAIIVLTYVPMIGNNKEAKTKPTQHGIKDLKYLGLFPNFILCRSDYELSYESIVKISENANLDKSAIVNVFNVKNLLEIPLIINKQGLEYRILEHFGLTANNYEIKEIKQLYKASEMLMKSTKKVKISLVGKYCNNTDAYYSVIKSLEVAAFFSQCHLELNFIQCDLFDNIKDLESLDISNIKIKEEPSLIYSSGSKSRKNSYDYSNKNEINYYFKMLLESDGVIMPGGFGRRGTESMINIIKIVREKKIPFFGICFGMQLAVIEFCRNVLGLKEALSKEFLDGIENKDNKEIIDVITDMDDTDYNILGGTLRLGIKKAVIVEDSLCHRIYGSKTSYDRHRHRYEVNNKFVKEIEEKGMKFNGKNETLDRIDMLELDEKLHPFYFGTQAHPEFKTSTVYPSLPFFAFIMYSSGQKEKYLEYYNKKINSSINDCEAEEMISKFDREYFSDLIDKISLSN